MTFSGSISGTTKLQSVPSASGTLTLPIVTDILVTKTTTDNFSNKNIDISIASNNIFSIQGNSITQTTGTGNQLSLSTSPIFTTPTLGNASASYIQVTGLNVSNGNVNNIVSTVSATAPILSGGGINPFISITQSSSSANGYLSSTDWNTFNNKGSGSGGGTVTSVGATAPIISSGGNAPFISVLKELMFF